MDIESKAFAAYDQMMQGAYMGDINQDIDAEINAMYKAGLMRLASTDDVPTWPVDCNATIQQNTMRQYYRLLQQQYHQIENNKARLYDTAKQLVALNLDNPFPYGGDLILNDKSTLPWEELADCECDVREPVYANEQLATHVMGVLPYRDQEGEENVIQ